MTTGLMFAGNLPDPEPERPPISGLDTLFDWLMWGGFAVCLAGLIIVGAMFAINMRRGEGAELVGRLAMVFIGVSVIGAAAGMIGVLAG